MQKFAFQPFHKGEILYSVKIQCEIVHCIVGRIERFRIARSRTCRNSAPQADNAEILLCVKMAMEV